MATFKEQNVEFQHLVRELMLLRKHNRAFKPEDPQDDLLLFAEAALVLVVLERFLRMLLGRSAEKQTLFSLLEMATSPKRGLLKLFGKEKGAIRTITDVRNALMHGDYEKAAKESGSTTVADYFKTQFASEVEALFWITDGLIKQIDHNTGKPFNQPS